MSSWTDVIEAAYAVAGANSKRDLTEACDLLFDRAMELRGEAEQVEKASGEVEAWLDIKDEVLTELACAEKWISKLSDRLGLCLAGLGANKWTRTLEAEEYPGSLKDWRAAARALAKAVETLEPHRDDGVWYYGEKD